MGSIEKAMASLRHHPDMLKGVPEHVVSDLRQYEDWFTIDPLMLKKITDRFVEELDKGLTVEGGNIPMNVTWVMGHPNGNETGRILTLDMGGTNLRVCDVCLAQGQGEADQIQRKYKLTKEIKNVTSEQLWDWVADRVKEFIHEHHGGGQGNKSFPLAFTFSFPVDQKNIRSGILQRWTKDFNVSGVEGHDVIPQLEAAFQRKEIPVQVVALINDTTGTLIASHYRDPEVKIGCVFSTGSNAAYMEECRVIPKLRHLDLPDDAEVIINTEYGAFDCDLAVLPATPFDHQIDRDSLRPGSQVYEKMVAGLYIGEMLRLILAGMHDQGKLFSGQDVSRLRNAHALDATFLSVSEGDQTEDLDEMRNEFKKTLNLDPSLDELKVCRYLIQLIATRAARLYACGIAAICKKRNLCTCHVGVDGSVFNKYSGFKERAMQGLREIFDWSPDEQDLIVLNPCEDGSSLGAALAAVLVLNRNGLEKVAKQKDGEVEETKEETRGCAL